MVAKTQALGGARAHLSLVGLSGLLMALALPPLSLWPLAWIALVPLWRVMVSTVGQPAWWAAGYGLLWGMVYYGLSLVWITHLHPLMWLGVPWAGSLAIALGVWVVITLWGAGFIALWGLGLGWVARHWPTHPGLRVAVGTALWVALEAGRNYSPLDWSPLSLTQSPGNLWILHLAQLSGPGAITATIVATNGLWAEARGRGLVGLGVALLVLSHTLGFGLYQQPAQADTAQAIALGLVQGNVPTREKLTPAGVNQAIRNYTEGYQSLAAQGVDGVITPEGALPVIWRQGDPQVARLTQTVGQTGVPLWLGTFAPAPSGKPGQYTQGLLELRPDGEVHGRYDKVQLVPLGEYIPFEPVLGKWISRLSPLNSYLVPGSPQQTFATQAGVGIVGICYESAYSRLFRRQALAGGEFIVTVSNNDPYPLGMMAQHHGFDVLRAVESDRWAIRVTNTGLSGLVDNHGRTHWLGAPNRFLVYRATLYRHLTLTPYVTWGDWLTPLLGVGAMTWAVFIKVLGK
ncbi:MAG TPA: apolipoprotein N-acyltransferase [Leptolyngbyaceae cyanobacterium M65_K2018_010]|nr:apolipoprotein N-acyltransferase [Leptolyngbyaceae cyanobacterium M65_K2018_010]